MLHRFFIAFTLIAIMLTACNKPSAPTVGADTNFATACDKANNGKRIALTGYLRLPDSFTGSQSVVLRIYETNDFSSKPIGVQTEFGSQANQAQPITDQYSDSDLKINLANGQVAQFGTRVKVSGNVYFPAVAQEFDCSLENPLVELAP